MSLEFLLTSLVIVLLPGTGVIYTIAIGLGRAFKSSVAAAFGCTLGIVPAAFASIVGLSALLHTSALGFQIIKYLGVAYLFYMAWSILRDGGAMDVKEDTSEKTLFKIAMTGTFINVLNPKLSLFFLSFLPLFISPENPNPTYQLVFLASIFMLMTFVVFVGYGAFAASARDYVIRRPQVMKWIKFSFAGAFGFIGLRLGLSD